ncbi:MAG: HAD family phosphatase [Lentimicrobium sp.]|jgi:putative hydrolase of the HAD superfamily|nr:HAD family phosphatase [Lentimicrobium sp.]
MKKPDLTGIKNIIFDFGNVLLNIDPRLTQQAFTELGIRPGVDFWGSQSSTELLINFEKGNISPDAFRKGALEMLSEGLTSEQVDQAWNALLLDFPSERVDLLKKLRHNYRLFLLSNSNEIHFIHYIKGFGEKFGFPLAGLFEKMWFSHQLRRLKPDPQIFTFVIDDAALQPQQTLFIDDTLAHVEAARSLGIKAWHLKPGQDVVDLFGG